MSLKLYMHPLASFWQKALIALFESALMQTAYGMIEQSMETRTWAAGDAFTLADCAAAPALFYANKVAPFGETHPRLAAYFDRLMQRPSYARTVREAEPYLKFFPQ